MPVICKCCCPACGVNPIPDCISLDLSEVDASGCFIGAPTSCGDTPTTTIILSKNTIRGNECAYVSCDPICFDGGASGGPYLVWATMSRYDFTDFTDTHTLGTLPHAFGPCGWILSLWWVDPSNPGFYFYPIQVFIKRGQSPLGSYGHGSGFIGSTCGAFGSGITATDPGAVCSPCPSFNSDSTTTNVCPSLTEICSTCCLEYSFHFTGTIDGVWDDITFDLVHPCTDEGHNFWEWNTQIDGVTYTGIIWCTTIYGGTPYWVALFQDTTGYFISLWALLASSPDCPPIDFADWSFAGDNFGGPIERGGPLAGTLVVDQCQASSSSVGSDVCPDYSFLAAHCNTCYEWQFSGGAWAGANVLLQLVSPDSYWHGGITLEGGNTLNGEMYCFTDDGGVTHWRGAFADEDDHQYLLEAPKQNNSDIGSDCPPAEGEWIEVVNTSGSTLSIIVESDCVGGAPVVKAPKIKNLKRQGSSLRVKHEGQEIILKHRHGISYEALGFSVIHVGDRVTLFDFRNDGLVMHHDVDVEFIPKPQRPVPLVTEKKRCGGCSRAKRNEGEK